MADVPVYDKSGNVIGKRGSGVGAGVVETESRADAYRRQKKGAREDWPGQHEEEAKKIEAEEAKARAAAGVASPASSASPSPTPKASPKVNPYKPSSPFS